PDGRDLSYAECQELLGHYGIDLWDRIPVTTADEAVAAAEQLGWDVVLKATAEPLRQRPDQAHVWRNIEDADEMRHAHHQLTGIITSVDDAAFVVQKTAPPGVPVRIDGLEDPLFGPAVSFSISGAITELVGDKAYLIPPITGLDAFEAVRSIKAAPLLFGHRGSEPFDTTRLEDLLARLARLADDLPEVAELELNPVLAGPDGCSVLAASGRLARPRARTDRAARALLG
ncbi:MAG: acetate--CoA ligase family protein, partial [Actinomycetes bacterium]